MEEIRYISKLADLTEIMLDVTNRYDECDSDEFSYVINKNYVNAEWLTGLDFRYKLFLEKIESEKRVFDKLPAKDGTPEKYPDFFESKVMVTAVNKKYTALRTAWKKTYELFYELLEAKIDVIATISRRVEFGGYSSVFYKAIAEGLDESHNSLADSIEALIAKYGEYTETLQAFVVFLGGISGESEPAAGPPPEKAPEEEIEVEILEVIQELEEVIEVLEVEFEAPMEENAGPTPKLRGTNTLVFTAVISFIIAIGGAIRLPTTFTWVEHTSGYDQAVNAVILGGASALVLIIIGILALIFRKKAKMAILLLCIGIACAVWGGLSVVFGFNEGAYMYFFDILTIIVAVMLIVGAAMNIKKPVSYEPAIYGAAAEEPVGYGPFVYDQEPYQSPVTYENAVSYESPVPYENPTPYESPATYESEEAPDDYR